MSFYLGTLNLLISLPNDLTWVTSKRLLIYRDCPFNEALDSYLDESDVLRSKVDPSKYLGKISIYRVKIIGRFERCAH